MFLSLNTRAFLVLALTQQMTFSVHKKYGNSFFNFSKQPKRLRASSVFPPQIVFTVLLYSVREEVELLQGFSRILYYK